MHARLVAGDVHLQGIREEFSRAWSKSKRELSEEQSRHETALLRIDKDYEFEMIKLDKERIKIFLMPHVEEFEKQAAERLERHTREEQDFLDFE